MFYREIGPPENLSDIILSFWEFAVPDNAPPSFDHEIFPDGCVSLFYVRNSLKRINFAGVSGPELKTVVRTVSAGDVYWGMRISPAACSAVLKTDMSQLLYECSWGITAIPQLSEGLPESLAPITDLESAIPVFESRIRGLPDVRVNLDRTVAKAVRIIEEARGEIRVVELAGILGLSTRQFQRRFKAASGLAPKQYIRVRRIRAAGIDLVEGASRNWADRAADLGFADQSHLTHEFVAITRRSPNSFARRVRKIGHGSLVK